MGLVGALAILHGLPTRVVVGLALAGRCVCARLAGCFTRRVRNGLSLILPAGRVLRCTAPGVVVRSALLPLLRELVRPVQVVPLTVGIVGEPENPLRRWRDMPCAPPTGAAVGDEVVLTRPGSD